MNKELLEEVLMLLIIWLVMPYWLVINIRIQWIMYQVILYSIYLAIGLQKLSPTHSNNTSTSSANISVLKKNNLADITNYTGYDKNVNIS